MERVTVIEAGPCFVTAIRRAERDGYDAIQLAFGEVAEKKLQKARRGHLGQGGRGHLRHLREFRGEAGELEIGAELKVDAVFEKGVTVKARASRRARGSPGRSSATTSTAGLCRTAPTTSVRPARSAHPPIRRAC